jgi:hypothetical protein
MRPTAPRCLTVLIAVTACNGNRVQSSSKSVSAVAPGVFTDSSVHAQQCEAVKPGEDWRVVCIPKDQRVPPPRPKQP